MHNVRVWKVQSQSIVPLLLWVIHPCWSLGSVPTYALLYLADLSVTWCFQLHSLYWGIPSSAQQGRNVWYPVKDSGFIEVPSWMFDQVAYGFVGLWTCWRQSSGICCSFSSCSRDGKRLVRALPWLLFPGKHLLCLSCWETTWHSIMGGNPLENNFLLGNREHVRSAWACCHFMRQKTYSLL